MSLQVWLPLDGTIENKGLGTVTKESGTATFDKASKIGGKALNLKYSNSFLCPQLANLKTFSVCFWGMVEPSSTLTTNWQDVLGFNDVKTDGTTGTFRWETGYNFTGFKGDGIHWHDNATNALVNNSYAHNISKSEWVHCCVVFDAESEKIYSYSNGVLKQTDKHLGGSFNSSGRFKIGEINNIEGRIQDVRFYDNALSPKEVKEISKGLCLHYRLSGHGCENLIKGNFSCASTNKEYVSNGSAICTLSANDILANKGKILTLSYDVFSLGDYTQNTPGSQSANRFGIHGSMQAIESGKTEKTQYYPFAESLAAGKNGRYSMHWQIPTNITSVVTPLSFTLQTNKNNGFAFPSENNPNRWYLKNVKLEWGSKTTPWTPNSSDALYAALGYNSTAEPDCTGFGNDGTKVGNIHCDSDTARYTTSYKFNGNEYINARQGAKISDELSVSVWAYMDDWSSYKGRLFSCTEGGGWNIEPNGSHFNFPVCVQGIGYTNCITATSYSSLKSGWHYFVVNYDGLTSKFYIDGKLDASKTNGLTVKTPIAYNPTNSIFIAAEATASADTPDLGASFTGKLSDFRIYATALSASDILDLYQTGASIDNGGNAWAYEYKEGE